jgi:hypothetical protein
MQFITTNILSVYYRTITRAGDPIPQRGTHLYARHYKRVHLTVITAYLLYTVYESYYSIRRTPTFYSLLSVPLTVDERALRSRFRRLSIKYHPDKVGAQGEAYFVLLKQAYEVLSDSVKRFAYDRFGPDMLGWKHCNSAYDYLVSGGTHLVPWYLGTLLFLVILTVLGKFEFGRYVGDACSYSRRAITQACVDSSAKITAQEGTKFANIWGIVALLHFLHPLNLRNTHPNSSLRPPPCPQYPPPASSTPV